MDLARADFDTDVFERTDAAEGLRHSGEADRNLARRGFFGGERHRPNILCERADWRRWGDWPHRSEAEEVSAGYFMLFTILSVGGWW